MTIFNKPARHRNLYGAFYVRSSVLKIDFSSLRNLQPFSTIPSQNPVTGIRVWSCHKNMDMKSQKQWKGGSAVTKKERKGAKCKLVSPGQRLSDKPIQTLLDAIVFLSGQLYDECTKQIYAILCAREIPCTAYNHFTGTAGGQSPLSFH